MTKQDFINELNAAKSAHVKWHAYAQALAMGVESGVEKLPQLYTDCDFGNWYYGAGHFLNFMPEFNAIEPVHEKLHKLYMQIYQEYLAPEKSGLFTSSAKAKEKKAKAMNNMVAQLKEISNVMIDKLSIVQNKVNAMSEEEILRKIM